MTEAEAAAWEAALEDLLNREQEEMQSTMRSMQNQPAFPGSAPYAGMDQRPTGMPAKPGIPPIPHFLQ
jgi:hypothetical protein